MLAETSKLYVEMAYRDNGFKAGMAGASRQTKALGLDMSKLQSGLGKIRSGIGAALKTSAIIGAGALGFLAVNVKKGIDSLAELEKLNNRTNAVIKSTGGIAHLTAKEISDLAGKYEDLTSIDDKVIQGGENLLLTFTNVRKKAFEPALLAALDLSTAMGTDLNGSIVQIGKALNDPIKGISALTRVGVTFTEQQKAQIKTLVEHNRLFDAQKIILDELNKEFGGQAKTAADGYEGSMRRLGDAVETLQQSLARALLPALTKVATKFAGLLKDPAVIQKVTDLGDALAGLVSDQNIDAGVSGVKKFFGFLADLPWSQIKDGISVSTRAAAKAVEVFRSLPPELQTGLIGLLAANKLTGGLVASGLGEIAKFTLGQLKTIYANSVTVISATGTGGGLPPGVPGTGPGTNPINSIVKGVGTVALVGTVATAIVEGVSAIDSKILTDQGYSADQVQKLQRITELQALQQSAIKHGASSTAEKLQAQIDILRSEVSAPLAHISANTGDTASHIQSERVENNEALTRIAARVNAANTAQVDAINGQSSRMTRLQMRLNGALMLGNTRAANRIQGKINQEIAATHGTKNAVDHNTGVLRAKKSTFTVNNTFRPSVNISGTAVASVVSKMVSRNRYVAS